MTLNVTEFGEVDSIERLRALNFLAMQLCSRQCQREDPPSYAFRQRRRHRERSLRHSRERRHNFRGDECRENIGET